ncbi:MAG TPA: FAD-dependent oxidoreductase [Candidatus Limnocylindrales bacterium]|nr:FAD-dependent oxidoreductase [Candidatus Limnocylindrales bacterium]
MRVQLVKCVQESPSISSFYFEPAHRFRYEAGQFVDLSIQPEGTTTYDRRWFSLSSSPTEPLLMITTRITEQPSHYKQTLSRMVPGTELIVSEAMGDFVLPLDPVRPLLFVAIGIGIAPFRSILQYIADTSQKRHITLVYMVRSKDELLFSEVINAVVPCDAQTIATEGSVGAVGETSMAARVHTAAKRSVEPVIYLAGPEPKVEALAQELTQRGYQASDIITDSFIGYAT